MALNRPLLTARALLDELLRSYAQVLFSRSAVVGALLLIATFLVPRVGLAGLLAAAVAAAAARLVRFSPEETAEGLYGYNAVLVGLGVGAAFAPGPRQFFLIVLGSLVTVILTAAGRATVAARWQLPVLTLPFLAGLWLALAAGSVLGLARAELVVDPFLLAGPADIALRGLRGLGVLFFVPRADAGILVAIALLIWSRHGGLLAGIGLVFAAIIAAFWIPAASAGLHQALALNMALTAIALGGMWFVPGPSASLFAVVGAAVAGLLTLGLAPVLGFLDLPVAVLPFNLATLGVLLATRLRLEDRTPKAVDFLLGTPEQHLHHHRTRTARFGSRYAVRLHAPFLGTWTCTQGENGEHTHQGAWWSAADFEVADATGRRHRGSGAHRTDWLCYRLPVVAPADATVIEVIDGLPDNEPGDEDLEHNWGNLVVLWVGPGLFVLLGHLSPGSIPVQKGQVVRRGDVVGRCGSSGRAPVPHLHIQLQSVGVPGAPTLPLELHDVIGLRDGQQHLCGALTPELGDAVRNIEVDDKVASPFTFAAGRPVRLRTSDGTMETLTAEVDPIGQRLLTSAETGARLVYTNDGRLFTVLDVLGARRSALHLVHQALARVPFECRSGLTWSDDLGPRDVLGGVGQWVLDAVRPYLPTGGFEMVYSAHESDDELIIEGQSTRTRADGSPVLTTRAALSARDGLRSVAVTRDGRTRSAEAELAPRAERPRLEVSA